MSDQVEKALVHYEKKIKELEEKLEEAVKEYKRIHSILCKGFTYYDEISEEFLSKYEH